MLGIRGLAGLVGLVILITACAGRPLPVPTAAQAAAVGSDLATVTAARSTYARSCSGCHALDHPADHDEKTWRDVMPDMAKKAKLTAQEAQDVLAYVLATRR